jgi:hypothetical protein
MGGGSAGQIAASRPRSRPGKRRARPWAHLGSGGDRCWGREHAGVDARRGPTAAAAVARPGQQVARDGFIGSKEGIGVVA